MNFTFLIVVTAAMVYLAILCSIPFRTKNALFNAGKLLLPLKNGAKFKVIAMFILSALVIAVIPLRNFAFYIQAVIALAALFATNMAAREAAGLGRAGIYENTIISSMSVLPFDDILSIPTIAYENDPETTGVDKTVIQLIRKSNSATVLLTFENEEKRQEALQVILKQKPELNVKNDD